jgi:hypothetical protein
MRKWIVAALTALAVPAFAADVVPTADSQPVQPLTLVARIDLPRVDRAAALAEDDANDAAGLPPRFALPNLVDLTPESAGTWETLPDPRVLLWRLHATAPGALSLNLGFDRYRLPKGGRLVLYPAHGRETAYAFTERDNRDHGQLWTPVVLGDDLVIELTLPVESRHDYELHLAAINAGYRLFGEDAGEKSGACNIDVVCPEGDPWRDEINANAVYTLNGTWDCSGSMVNNTAQDATPYFLTANHCGISSGNAATMVVYWNFQSPTCGQHGGGSLSQFQTGAIFRASYATSDFCLVELQQMPDPSWNVTYNGWDRSTADATSAVGIHHPNTDEKSISFEFQPTTTTTYLQNAVPGNGSHIRITDWDLGTTEPGSSGSPLYDQNHHVIGQLHGGYAACGNDLSDWYGRFSMSWAGGGTNATRLSNWLDPLGTAPMALDLFDPDASGMRVLPSGGLSSQGNAGGPFDPASQVYTIENNGTFPIAFQVTDDAGWVTVVGGSGVLDPGGTAQVTVDIGPGANSLPNGVYDATVTFTNLTDGNGDTIRPVHLQVGVPQVAYSFPLDTNPGWVSSGGQWAWGHPTGGGGEHGSHDPTNGYTGVNVYGYNLSGDYTNNMPEYHLTTTAIDCSGWQAVSVRFRRWLGVEQPSYDHAYFRVSNDGVNWTTVWQNGSEIADAAWQLVSYDISAIADGHRTVYLRWTMGTTDSSWLYCGWNVDDVEILGLPGIQVAVGDVPANATALRGASPNPFNPRTDIHFELARAGRAQLSVFDPRGRLVRVLADADLPAGSHVVTWDGTDATGRLAASGVYFLRLEAAGVTDVGKVMLMK